MNMKDKALELWNYLATTGEPNKCTAYRILGFAPDFNECPLCELASEPDAGEIDCKRCLLYNRWHGRNHSDHKTCMDNDTYNSETYVQLWYQARTTISRQVYAKAVHYNLLKEWETELDD